MSRRHNGTGGRITPPAKAELVENNKYARENEVSFTKEIEFLNIIII
ncbi:hypothetical protein [Xenorhabdus cabanillasii]|nr:hypothetical protein [Xenorhabdus cabanillasii]